MLAGVGVVVLLALVILEVDDDIGAVACALGRLDVVTVDAVRLPGPRLV